MANELSCGVRAVTFTGSRVERVNYFGGVIASIKRPQVRGADFTRDSRRNGYCTIRTADGATYSTVRFADSAKADSLKFAVSGAPR